jgi:hypothetical protein
VGLAEEQCDAIVAHHRAHFNVNWEPNTQPSASSAAAAFANFKKGASAEVNLACTFALRCVEQTSRAVVSSDAADGKGRPNEPLIEVPLERLNQLRRYVTSRFEALTTDVLKGKTATQATAPAASASASASASAFSMAKSAGGSSNYRAAASAATAAPRRHLSTEVAVDTAFDQLTAYLRQLLSNLAADSTVVGRDIRGAGKDACLSIRLSTFALLCLWYCYCYC